jgi:MFS family permease
MGWGTEVFRLIVTLAIAQTLLALGLILSGFTTNIGQLALTQGLMCGLGTGLVSPAHLPLYQALILFTFVQNFMATQPLISQWFLKRRALAMGISSGGVGAGGLLFSFTTRLALANHGVRFAYIMNGIIVFVMLTPTTFFFKCEYLCSRAWLAGWLIFPGPCSARMHVSHPKFKAIRWKLLKNWGLVFLCIWAFFVTYGYLVSLFSIASYATQGLGLRLVLLSSLLELQKLT